MSGKRVTECALCGGTARIIRESRPIRIGRRTAVVEDETTRCDACGEEYATPEQMRRTQERAVRKIRDSEGLLQPEEIRSLRASLGLTQAQFEALLGTGPKTVVRWESGAVFQSSTANTLMWMLENVPGAASRLAARHGVELDLEDATSWSVVSGSTVELGAFAVTTTVGSSLVAEFQEVEARTPVSTSRIQGALFKLTAGRSPEPEDYIVSA